MRSEWNRRCCFTLCSFCYSHLTLGLSGVIWRSVVTVMVTVTKELGHPYQTSNKLISALKNVIPVTRTLTVFWLKEEEPLFARYEISLLLKFSRMLTVGRKCLSFEVSKYPVWHLQYMELGTMLEFWFIGRLWTITFVLSFFLPSLHRSTDTFILVFDRVSFYRSFVRYNLFAISPVSRFVCPFIRSSVRLSVCLSVCRSVGSSFHPSPSVSSFMCSVSRVSSLVRKARRPLVGFPLPFSDTSSLFFKSFRKDEGEAENNGYA